MEIKLKTYFNNNYNARYLILCAIGNLIQTKNSEFECIYCDLIKKYNEQSGLELNKNSELIIEQNYLSGKGPLFELDFIDIIDNIIFKLPPVLFRKFYTYLINSDRYELKNFSAISETLKANRKKYNSIALDLEEHYKKILIDKILKSKSVDSLIYDVYGLQISSDATRYKKNEKYYIEPLKQYASAQILCELFFSDTFKNVSINMNSLKSFTKRYESTVPVEIKNKFDLLYRTFFEIINKTRDSDSITKIKMAYYDLMLKHINYQELLYDVFNFAKVKTSEIYKNSLTDFRQFPCQKIYGVNVYMVNTNDYRTLITATDMKRNDIDYNLFKQSKRTDTISCSLVDKDNLITFRDLRKNFAVVYDDFPIRQLEIISEYDNFSLYNLGDTKVSSFPHSFVSPEELTSISGDNKEYNECTIINPNRKKLAEKFPDMYFDFKEVKPTYVFCLGSSTDKEIKVEPNEIDFARQMGIPIVYVINDNYQFFGEQQPRYGFEYDDTL